MYGHHFSGFSHPGFFPSAVGGYPQAYPTYSAHGYSSRPLASSASVTTPSYTGSYSSRIHKGLAISKDAKRGTKEQTKQVYGGVMEPKTHIGITSTRSETSTPLHRVTEPATSRPRPKVREPLTTRPPLARRTTPESSPQRRTASNVSPVQSPRRGERIAVTKTASPIRSPRGQRGASKPVPSPRITSSPARAMSARGSPRRGGRTPAAQNGKSPRVRTESYNSAEDIESSSSSSSLVIKPADDCEDLTVPASPLHRTSAGATNISRKQSVEEMVQTMNRSPKRTPPRAAKKGKAKGKGKGAKAKDPESEKVGVDDFEVIKVLGKGGFAKVFLVRKKTTGMVYAMKVIRKSTAMRERKGVEYCETEQNVLSRVNHPFIVGLKWSFQTRQKLYLVLDYGAGGELYFHLRRRRKFAEDVVKFYAAEIVLAFERLHEIGIIYRDLKPENVCFGADGHLILTDFGLSKQDISSNRRAHSFCGTAEYMAPEMISQSGHGRPVDWWSLGVIIYELLTGRPPYSSPVQSSNEVMHKIMVGDLYMPSEASEQARSIIRGLLQRDPQRRLGTKNDAEEVKAHPFFKGVEWEALLAKKVTPPLIPSIQSETDTSNFDPNVVASEIHDADDYDDPILNERPYMFKGFAVDTTHQSPDRRARTAPHRRTVQPSTGHPYRANAPANTRGGNQGNQSQGVYSNVPLGAMYNGGHYFGMGGLGGMSHSRPHFGGGMRYY